LTFPKYNDGMFIASSRPTNLKTSVAAYLDGTSTGIQTNVLKGQKQLVASQQAGDLDRLSITGTRLSPEQEKKVAAKYFAGMGALVATGVAIGMLASPDIGALVGLAAVPPGFLGVRHLQAALTAPKFAPGSPTHEAGHLQRFEQSLSELPAKVDGSLNVAYLSGHGSHKAIGGLSPKGIGKALSGSEIDFTVLDACSTGQLEVLAQLAPFAGLTLCSVHPVPGRGFPIQKMFEPSENHAIHAFESALQATSSLTLVDTKKLSGQLLPALDLLGQGLVDALDHGERAKIRKALVKSKNPDLVGPRVEMRTFLKSLGEQKFDKGLKARIKAAQDALENTVVRDTGSAMSFRLDGAQDGALPSGWQDFIDRLGLRFKPFL
jgi:cysteine peptidase C11 family protein